MTTILADTRFGVMVADSMISDGDRRWPGRKVFRRAGAVIGFAGHEPEFAHFLDWYARGMTGRIAFSQSAALILKPGRLEFFDANYASPVPVRGGRLAIGTGGKTAMAAYEALGWYDPKRAVTIACRHDASSSAPVRVYRV